MTHNTTDATESRIKQISHSAVASSTTFKQTHHLVFDLHAEVSAAKWEKTVFPVDSPDTSGRGGGLEGPAVYESITERVGLSAVIRRHVHMWNILQQPIHFPVTV